MNVVMELPSEVEEASAMTREELLALLEVNGHELSALSLADANALWRQSVGEARAHEQVGFEAAAREFAIYCAQRQAFDLLVIPSVLLREVVLRDQSTGSDGATRVEARWDGARAVVEVEGKRFLAGASIASLPVQGAASLHVAIFDPQGRKLHENTAGLDLISTLRFRHQPGGKVEISFPPRSPDRKRLRQGIVRAFEPFLRLRLPAGG